MWGSTWKSWNFTKWGIGCDFSFMLLPMSNEPKIIVTCQKLEFQSGDFSWTRINLNTVAFVSRFLEVLDYYTNMFESTDATLNREHIEWIDVEQHYLMSDIDNIIAWGEMEIVEWNELLVKWKSRFRMIDFNTCPPNFLVNNKIKMLNKISWAYWIVDK